MSNVLVVNPQPPARRPGPHGLLVPQLPTPAPAPAVTPAPTRFWEGVAGRYDLSMESGAFSLGELEQAEAEMAAVQSAIDAIDAGTYAVCRVCGNDMTSTVAANPLALTCDDHLALA